MSLKISENSPQCPYLLVRIHNESPSSKVRKPTKGSLENIFKSQQAEELLRVLKGVLECENNTLLTSALSTYLMGGNAEKLAFGLKVNINFN